jgi:hypothetical protein
MDITLLTMNPRDRLQVIAGFIWFSNLTADEKLEFINSINVEQADRLVSIIRSMMLFMAIVGTRGGVDPAILADVNDHIVDRAEREIAAGND